VPEITVTKDCNLISGKGYIGFPENLILLPIPQFVFPKKFLQLLLDVGASVSDSGHVSFSGRF
jgi:hypothetical protein